MNWVFFRKSALSHWLDRMNWFDGGNTNHMCNDSPHNHLHLLFFFFFFLTLHSFLFIPFLSSPAVTTAAVAAAVINNFNQPCPTLFLNPLNDLVKQIVDHCIIYDSINNASIIDMSKSRVYADVNVVRPREYWDYEALTVQWG